MSGCCNNPLCRRTKPIRLSYSELTGRWYFLTDYTERSDGGVTAKTKHQVSPEQARQLDEMHDALHHPGKKNDDA